MFYKKVVTVTLFATMVITLLNSGIAPIQAKTADNIKIGLYFAGTACSSYTVSAVKGLQISRILQNSSNILITENSDQLTVRKDAWFYKNNGTLNEYSPGTQVNGEKLGPYHLKLFSCSSLQDALKKTQTCKISGVQAYLAYTGQWEVWTGYYTTAGEAAADISKYQKQADKDTISVTGPPTDRYNPNIAIEKIDGSTLLLYADKTGYLQLKPSEANNPCIIKVNGKNYRGALELRRQEGSDMTAINYIDVESYLYGVVPSEIESFSQSEALKSQALVARNYTLCNLGKFSKWGFDLDTTIQSQVYKGYDGEAASTNKAVDETRGMVLKDRDGLAQCFYFSSSGGRTEDVTNVWGSKISYLQSVDDPYESGKSARYNWEKAITADRVKEIMKGRGYDIGDITGIEVTKRSDAGRAIEISITGTKGTPVTFYRETCRTIFGLDSQLFNISTDAKTYITTESQTALGQVAGKKAVSSNGAAVDIKVNNGQIAVAGADGKIVNLPVSRPTKYIFEGKGYGHAVGFSQEGAKGFAGVGRKYDEILLHYFPGTYVGMAE